MYSFRTFYILATTMYVKVKSFKRKYITLPFPLAFKSYSYNCRVCFVFHAIHAMEQQKNSTICYILAIEKACKSTYISETT